MPKGEEVFDIANCDFMRAMMEMHGEAAVQEFVQKMGDTAMSEVQKSHEQFGVDEDAFAAETRRVSQETTQQPAPEKAQPADEKVVAPKELAKESRAHQPVAEIVNAGSVVEAAERHVQLRGNEDVPTERPVVERVREFVEQERSLQIEHEMPETVTQSEHDKVLDSNTPVLVRRVERVETENGPPVAIPQGETVVDNNEDVSYILPEVPAETVVSEVEISTIEDVPTLGWVLAETVSEDEASDTLAVDAIEQLEVDDEISLAFEAQDEGEPTVADKISELLDTIVIPAETTEVPATVFAIQGDIELETKAPQTFVEQLDTLIDEVIPEPEQTAAHELLAQIQSIILEDIPLIEQMDVESEQAGEFVMSERLEAAVRELRELLELGDPELVQRIVVQIRKEILGSLETADGTVKDVFHEILAQPTDANDNSVVTALHELLGRLAVYRPLAA